MAQIQFHQKSLDLFVKPPTKLRLARELKEMASREGIALPKAFIEWVSFDGPAICAKYSNDDTFFGNDARLVKVDDQGQGLLYQRENQGNFDLVCLLDGGDDPPVLFGAGGHEPWTPYCCSFSDAVFCHLFDWQYMVEFVDGEKEIAHYAGFDVRSRVAVHQLARQFGTLPSTSLAYRDSQFQTYRFAYSPTSRIVASESESELSITVLGATPQDVFATEDELIRMFGSNVKPESFTTVLFALLELDRLIRIGRSTTKLGQLFSKRPTDSQLLKLSGCLGEHSIKGLRTPDWDDDPETSFSLHIPAIQASLMLIRKGQFAWEFDSMS